MIKHGLLVVLRRNSIRKEKRKDDSPKNVEEFIEVCPNLDPEDAENLRKEDESSKREERKKYRR
jgi:hypothetical protein